MKTFKFIFFLLGSPFTTARSLQESDASHFMPKLWHGMAHRVIDYNLEVFASTSLTDMLISVQIEDIDI